MQGASQIPVFQSLAMQATQAPAQSSVSDAHSAPQLPMPPLTGPGATMAGNQQGSALNPNASTFQPSPAQQAGGLPVRTEAAPVSAAQQQMWQVERTANAETMPAFFSSVQSSFAQASPAQSSSAQSDATQASSAAPVKAVKQAAALSPVSDAGDPEDKDGEIKDGEEDETSKSKGAKKATG